MDNLRGLEFLGLGYTVGLKGSQKIFSETSHFLPFYVCARISVNGVITTTQNGGVRSKKTVLNLRIPAGAMQSGKGRSFGQPWMAASGNPDILT